MRSRPRDFIYTRDDLFFATTSYLHPADRIISFLRYIPDSEGERSRNGRKYSKVDSNQAYHFLVHKFPEYLFDCQNTKIKMMGVPTERITEILRPEKRLQEILNHPSRNGLLDKVVKLADIFHTQAKIPYNKMGISGSILPDLHHPEKSDIDLVIYGLAHHRKAIDYFAEIKDKNLLKRIDEEYWRKLYQKRIKDSSLSYDEFKWYEERKNNRGVIQGTLFDILATRDWDEIKGIYGEESFEHLGTAIIKGTVSNALAAFDNPAIYKIEDVDIIEGVDVKIAELASFTHTYAGQARESERIMARGKLEKVVGKRTKYRLIVGTMRESVGEYIKLQHRVN